VHGARLGLAPEQEGASESKEDVHLYQLKKECQPHHRFGVEHQDWQFDRASGEKAYSEAKKGAMWMESKQVAPWRSGLPLADHRP